MTSERRVVAWGNRAQIKHRPVLYIGLNIDILVIFSCQTPRCAREWCWGEGMGGGRRARGRGVGGMCAV